MLNGCYCPFGKIVRGVAIHTAALTVIGTAVILKCCKHCCSAHALVRLLEWLLMRLNLFVGLFIIVLLRLIHGAAHEVQR